ncbi:MAG TPA: protein kinase [Polyangiales bacterium]|nr:protein kinase [Polyangiales bacterium]
MVRPAKEESSRSGDLLNDAYELHELLESDGDQHTYRATDTRNGSSVQIKLLRPELALQSGAVQRFLQVPKTLSGLRHPNLSQVIAIESDELGIPFVVEEHVQGEPLGRTVASFPQGMPLGVAINVLCPVVEAVAAAHERGVVHGRLQLEHVLLAKAGGNSVPKVTRFGFAPAGADARSDVWALGALLYQTLGGQTIASPGARHEPLDELAPHLPVELTSLVERCLRKDPAARPASAIELRDALGAAADRLRGVERKSAEIAAPPASSRGAPTAQSKPAPAAKRSPVAQDAPVAFDKRALDTKPAPDAKPARAASKPAPDSKRALDSKRAPDSKPAPAKPLGLAATIASPRAASSPTAESFERATVAQRPAPEPRSAPPAAASLPCVANEDAALAATVAAIDDVPERTRELAASKSPPKAKAAPEKTLSDLAAAFGPMEGSDSVGQGESVDANAARSFRKAFEEEQRTAAGRRGARAARPVAAAAVAKDDERESKPVAPISRKQAREEPKPGARGLSHEQLRKLRDQGAREESRRDRWIGAFFFFLFVIGLALFTPLLCDPTHEQASALLGARANVVLAGFSVLSVIALIRVWTVQIHAQPMLLRPVTTTLKVVTALVCLLTASFFLPAGALGPIERFARMALPWASSFFYLFLAFYGLLRSAREAASNATAALALGVLYCCAFFGSYRVLAQTVFAKKRGAGALMASAGSPRSTASKLADMVRGETPVVEVPQADAGTDEPMRERSEVGASEAEDMNSIKQLEDRRKTKSAAFDQLGGKVKDLAQ